MACCHKKINKLPKMEGKISISHFEPLFFLFSLFPSYHCYFHLLLGLWLTKPGSLGARLAHPENSGLSEHLFSPKTSHGSGTFGGTFCQDRHSHHRLSLSWSPAVALHFLELVNGCVYPGQGSGTVVAVNCSTCQRKWSIFPKKP